MGIGLTLRQVQGWDDQFENMERFLDWVRIRNLKNEILTRKLQIIELRLHRLEAVV